MMTSRERVLCALHNRETDRTPFAPLIDAYYIDSLPEQGISDDILGVMKRIGCDMIERHWAKPLEVCPQLEIKEQISSEGTIRRKYYETPVGSIYEEYKVSGGTVYRTKYKIETLEDMKVYQYICEHTNYREQIQLFRQREACIGDNGITTTDGKLSPIQRLLQHECGVENTVYLMADYPEEMEELLQTMHEENLREYRVLLDYPTEVVFDYEDTSSTVMSIDMFARYSLPQINDYARILQDNGKLFITHMCGKLNNFTEVVGKGIQNGIDSVCPPETGDLEIWDARACWGRNKVILGGLEPAYLRFATPKECVAKVEEIFRRLPDRRGILISSGDAVAYGTPIENLIAIAEYVKEHDS